MVTDSSSVYRCWLSSHCVVLFLCVSKIVQPQTETPHNVQQGAPNLCFGCCTCKNDHLSRNWRAIADKFLSWSAFQRFESNLSGGHLSNTHKIKCYPFSGFNFFLFLKPWQWWWYPLDSRPWPSKANSSTIWPNCAWNWWTIQGFSLRTSGIWALGPDSDRTAIVGLLDEYQDRFATRKNVKFSPGER